MDNNKRDTIIRRHIPTKQYITIERRVLTKKSNNMETEDNKKADDNNRYITTKRYITIERKVLTKKSNNKET
jgi:hypothetical protein